MVCCYLNRTMLEPQLLSQLVTYQVMSDKEKIVGP